VTTRGVLYLHSAPRALCPHVEWAVGGVLDTRVSLDWIRQPAAPGSWRAELSWQGEPSTASRLASALRGWQLLRFEVTAEPVTGCEGEGPLEAEISRLLGKPWDDELEPFRHAGEGTPVRWLHQVV